MPLKSPKIRLDELVLARGLAESRPQAQRLVGAGQVWIGDRVADKPGLLVAENAAVRVEQGLPYVSRGGLKLAAALDAFDVNPADWVCADIGASTGGFTDCLLQRGAARVYAVDVGYGQLAWSLRQNPRVVSIERTNIRYLISLPEPVTLATVDVSFIGLGLVLPAVVKLLVPAPTRSAEAAPMPPERRARESTPHVWEPDPLSALSSGGQVIALIKPQFEVGKGQVSKGGVVREPALHRAVIEKALAEAAALGLAPAGLIRSPITGPAGNVEFLAWLRLGGEAPGAEVETGWIEGCLE
ncbi:MAG: TlyA family RNA methyltransferase [Chloroflexi bacterium]|nr:TlyA family RNA methyltransferase [Chloroflexota bacterium]